LEKICAELLIKIKKESNLNETKTLQKWQQLIKNYQDRGIDVNESSNFAKPGRIPPDEIWVVIGSGERAQTPNYNAMYALLGEFIQFLYEEMLYIGPLNISLERKCLVFEIQTQIP
jgi:hypothetical protein